MRWWVTGFTYTAVLLARPTRRRRSWGLASSGTVVGGKHRLAVPGQSPRVRRSETLRLVVCGSGEVAVDAGTRDPQGFGDLGRALAGGPPCLRGSKLVAIHHAGAPADPSLAACSGQAGHGPLVDHESLQVGESGHHREERTSPPQWACTPRRGSRSGSAGRCRASGGRPRLSEGPLRSGRAGRACTRPGCPRRLGAVGPAPVFEQVQRWCQQWGVVPVRWGADHAKR
jgi:hypothetical protein